MFSYLYTRTWLADKNYFDIGYNNSSADPPIVETCINTEILAAIGQESCVRCNDDVCEVLVPVELDAGEETTLDGVVAQHKATAAKVDYEVGDNKTYSEISDAIDALKADISGVLTGKGKQSIKVYPKAAGYHARFDAQTGFSGMSEADYIDIEAMVPHGGIRGEGIVLNPTTFGSPMFLTAQYTHLHGFAVTFDSSGAVVHPSVFEAQVGGRFYDNFVYDVDSHPNVNATVFSTVASGGTPALIYNNLIEDICLNSGKNVVGIRLYGVSQAYNNTVVNVNGSTYGRGFDLPSNSAVCINNYSGDNSDEDFYTLSPPTFEYNISSDVTAGSSDNNLSEKAAENQFVDDDEGTQDLHLLVGADCNRVGSDQGSLFTTDADGVTRVNWNTGAYEYQA